MPLTRAQRDRSDVVKLEAMKNVCLVYLEGEKLRSVPDRECMDCGDAFRRDGVMTGGEALQPVTTAATVRIRDGRLSVTDGPFAETKEQLAGFDSARGGQHGGSDPAGCQDPAGA